MSEERKTGTQLSDSAQVKEKPDNSPDDSGETIRMEVRTSLKGINKILDKMGLRLKVTGD